MTKDELKLALKHAKRDERHLSNVESRYWCDQYKLLATQAIEALAQTEQEKTVCPFCSSEWVTAEQHDRKVDRLERLPLTDEEIKAIEDGIWKPEFFDDIERQANCEFARAIEAAHGIKG